MMKFEVAETATHVLRGGERFTLDRTEYADAGINKVLDYGEGRYLRDGALSVVTLPAQSRAKEWVKLLAKVAGGSADVDADTFSLTAGAVKAIKEKSIPSAWTWQELSDAVDVELNAQALAHAESRRDALYSGIISEGRIASASPEVPYLRKFVTQVLVKYAGLKVSTVPKLPGTVDALRGAFVGFEGLTLPDSVEQRGIASLGEWFDNANEHATAAVEAEKAAHADLL